jgi:hypothetical protein
VLYGLLVDWKLELLDNGQSLYTKTAESRPAESIEFQSREGSPEWAAYAVMMDSAYYNYLRDRLESSGLPALFTRSNFQFQ